MTIFRVHGPFLFGATDKLQAMMDRVDELPLVVVFRLRNMTAIDATGLRALEDAAAALRQTGRAAVFCGARPQPRAVLEQAGFAAVVGEENVCANVSTALKRAEQIWRANQTAGSSQTIVYRRSH